MASINAKLSRGDEHFQALNQEYAKYQEAQPWKMSTERNDEATKFVLGIRFEVMPDFLRWGLLIGETVYNYRCALDHMIYALAAQEAGGVPTNARQLAFPITSSSALFKKARRSIKGIPKGAQEVVAQLQPYQEKKEVRLHPLTLLRELNDIDKHRTLHVVTFSVRETRVTGLPAGVLPSVNEGPLEQEDWLVGMETDEPHPGPELDAHLKIRLGLAEEGFSHDPVLELLSGIRQEVLGAIDGLRRFETK